MWALLHAAGIMPPFGVPLIGSLCFWGGLCGLAFGLAQPRLLPRAPMRLLGLELGLLSALVGWFAAPPLRASRWRAASSRSACRLRS